MIDRSISEVALSAEEQSKRVLILQLIHGSRLGEVATAVFAPEMVPEYFWSRRDQLRSAVNARFLTGVQTVLTPITPKLKSGLQVAPADGNLREVGADQSLAMLV